MKPIVKQLCANKDVKKKIDNQQGPTVQHRELYSVLCNDLYGKRI